jgi:hypothetical protein
MTDAAALHRLVYFSRNRVTGDDPAILAEIDSILEASRRNNARSGVTGALIFNGGVFAQVLEGPRDAIQSTFERIQRDARHGAVEVLAFERIEERGFPNWSMAFVGEARAGQDLFGHLGAATGFEAKRLEGERVFAILREIALEEEKTRAD